MIDCVTELNLWPQNEILRTPLFLDPVCVKSVQTTMTTDGRGLLLDAAADDAVKTNVSAMTIGQNLGDEVSDNSVVTPPGDHQLNHNEQPPCDDTDGDNVNASFVDLRPNFITLS